MAEEENWFPLESNPEVLNPYSSSLGFDISKYQWYDLLSIEEWGQEMIPQPCLALVFLYPITENTEKYDKEERERPQQVDSSVYFMKQEARNACGTIAVMHSMLNVDSSLVEDDSILKDFLTATKNLSPDERAKYFKGCNDLKQNHQQAVQGGQCQQQEEVETHFIAFIEKEGHLYELDGRKQSPINHGVTTQENFLQDACVIVKKLMDRDPDNVNFTLVVLAQYG